MSGNSERAAALLAVATLHAGLGAEDLAGLTREAEQLLPWLNGVRLAITVNPRTYEQGSPARPPVQTRYSPGGEVQLTDTQQVTLSVDPQDSKGFDVADTLTWTSSDGTVVAVQPSADGKSCLCVAGVPGTGIVVTVTDGTLTATDNFDVVPGTVAQLKITEGTPEEQPPPAP